MSRVFDIDIECILGDMLYECIAPAEVEVKL